MKINTKDHDLNVSLGGLILREPVGRFASALSPLLGYIWVVLITKAAFGMICSLAPKALNAAN